jgi:hypothetical protein
VEFDNAVTTLFRPEAAPFEAALGLGRVACAESVVALLGLGNTTATSGFIAEILAGTAPGTAACSGFSGKFGRWGAFAERLVASPASSARACPVSEFSTGRVEGAAVANSSAPARPETVPTGPSSCAPVPVHPTGKSTSETIRINRLTLIDTSFRGWLVLLPVPINRCRVFIFTRFELT